MKKNSEIIWSAISESNITGSSIDKENEILYLRFKGGNAYAYEGFSFDKYKEFRSTDSIMSYFHSNIKSLKTTKL